jgi:hypothetical protein
MTGRLQVKPLTDHLTGLQRKIDRLDESDITKSITDCIQFILIETAWIDSEVEQL